MSQQLTQPAIAWHDMLGSVSVQAREVVCQMAAQHRRELATHFYEQMLQDEEASRLISHDQVKTRLHSAMMQWIANLFAVKSGDDVQPLIEQQTRIGEGHARIDVPVHLVLRGAGQLKVAFVALLRQSPMLDAGQRLEALWLVSQAIDMAMQIMSQAYGKSHDRNSRAEEAYRLFSVIQNAAAEQERQRAAMLDWENLLMFELAINPEGASLPQIRASEFGLWFRHKGAHAFEGARETDIILQAMDAIDMALLPGFAPLQNAAPEVRVQQLRDLREQTSNIGFSLEALFQQSGELESGRDVLTRLLNRKFLPVVLSKVVKVAVQQASYFAVLAIDIDYFKKVNDTYGHEAGDMVLQQLGSMLVSSCRGGDYTFRLGGEEFLMIVVDVTAANALKVAEKLRQQVQDFVFNLPGEQTLKLSISVGAALNDGHPDYQRTLNQADEALYKAKHNGRNRVEAAWSAH